MPKDERENSVSVAISKAREVLRLFAPEQVAKGIWGSPMGKTLLAKRIVSELPEHRVYVEPFAGGAQVLFAKEPSEVEVVSDLDPEIAFAFKFVQGITPAQLEILKGKKWIGDKAHFKSLIDSQTPGEPVERFYRFAYLSRFSFNKLRRGTMPDKNVGVEARFIDRLEKLAPRLKNIKARNTDYERIVDEYDGPNTFFFLDPPYAGYDADARSGVGNKEWDEERFHKVLKKIRGRFLCTYGTRGDASVFDGFNLRRWRHTSGVGTSQGKGLQTSTTLVATNYDPDRVRRFQVAVSKTIWGSPAGKKKLSERLAAMLPTHKTYVEPFAGSAAVLFAKDPTDVEVINDADVEIARAYRTIKRLTHEQIDKLRSKSWTGDEAKYKRLIAENPKGDVDNLYRFLYLTHFSYGKLRGKSFSPSSAGVEARTMDRVEAFAPRLKNVRVYDGDYLKVVKKYDGPNTVFFLDPPYTGHNVDVGESDFDEERFFEMLKSLKGKFLLTYGIRGKLPKLLKASRFNVKTIRTRRSIRSMRGVDGSEFLTQLLVTNYEPLKKCLDSDDEWIVEDWRDTEEQIAKRQPFGTFGGSHHYAKRIVPFVPEHKTYVEPFAGAAALLHVKEPSAKEILADTDDDLVFMHRFIKGMDDGTLEKLKTHNWTCTESSWRQVRDLTPKNDVERFYKLAFIRGKGRDARPDATHAAGAAMGQTTNPKKYLDAAVRLKDVSILKQDYRKTIKTFDGPDTFFFLDPPYPGEWFDKNAAIDLDEFIESIGAIEGRFIAVLNDSPENVAAFKKVGRIFRLKVREAAGTGGAKKESRLFCSNFKIQKADVVDLNCDFEEEVADESPPVFSKEITLIKGIDEDDERFVLGIVLTPDDVDAQGDIYSAQEIRQAAHRFMEEYGGIGLMHRFRVNDQVKVLESYLAPSDFEIDGTKIIKGTWLLAVRILSDELWEQIKSGKLTGFSIGGSARRIDEHTNDAKQKEAAA